MNKLEKNMFMYAFRYAVNRDTYAFDDVMEVYNILNENFEPWEIKNMISDIEHELKWSNSHSKVQKLNYMLKELTRDLIKSQDRIKEE